ncbi:MAG: glycosyltransferase family 39 protein [Betaproteobacteria bacterium]
MHALTGLRRGYAAALVLTLAFRLWLAALVPFTGDEAYFTYWGVFPGAGFYDHPPMVGWLLALMLKISAAEWVLRLPSLLLAPALSLVVLAMLRPFDEARAWLAATAFLLVPMEVWNVFITTDTPLALWSFLSVAAFAAGLRASAPGGRKGLAWFALAGLFLGLALLSKYFAGLLAIAYGVYALFSPRRDKPWRGVLLAWAVALPFLGFNFYWNYENCWANLMFNLYNRHGDAGWSWRTPLLYFATVLYAFSPVALLQLLRGQGSPVLPAGDKVLRFVFVCTAFPFAAFAALSLVKQIGLHWVLSFVPVAFVFFGMLLSRAQLARSVVYLGCFSLLHVAAVLVVANLPLETWKNSRIYDGLVYTVETDQLVKALRPYAGEFAMAADGYSPAVTISYEAARTGLEGAGLQAGDDTAAWRRNYFLVFGTASSHARHDDILTDFRPLDGRNILVLRKNAPQAGEYAPYFKSVEYRSFTVRGATFHLVLGRGFDYPAYRERILVPLVERYYRIPAYLPQGRCDFCERYLSQQYCPVR